MIYTSNRDGGSTDEQGHYKFFSEAFTGEVLKGLIVQANSPLGMSVKVGAGTAKIPYSDYAYASWIPIGGEETLTVGTANASNPRIDRVVMYLDRTAARQQVTPNNPGIAKLKIVPGTPGAVPVRPTDAAVNSSVSNNPWINLGDIRVNAGVTQITAVSISDTRVMASALYVDPNASKGWYGLGVLPSSIVYNGNRSYTETYTGVDLTGFLSNGMRNRYTRTIIAPTQCTSLNGTNQYYSKTSPAGMTFTDDFVVGAWVKLSSYSRGAIISRYNGTSGWMLFVDTTGQIYLQCFNGGAGNFSLIVSTQSVPLNKWVHVTAQIDMSAFTASNTTSYIMIDGVDVPIQLSRAGTNPTALVQAGDLQIGRENISNYFPGKIAQAFVTSAKVTQATIRSNYINQSISPTETYLISAYSFNNSINDLNTNNPNNLTANGGAVATNGDSPFTQNDRGIPTGSEDCSIQTSIVSTGGNTTRTVQVPEGCTIPTVGGVSAVVYSSNKVPYGFPCEREKWMVKSIYSVPSGQSNPTVNQIYNPNIKINVPIGPMEIGYNCQLYVLRGSAGSAGIVSHLSTSPTTAGDKELVGRVYGVSLTELLGAAFRNKGVTVQTMTDYYFNLSTDVTNIVQINQQGDKGDTVIYAVPSHL